MKGGELVVLGAALVLLGMVMIFAGILGETLSAKGDARTEVRGGGVVMIGPIPLIFGTDRESAQTVMVLAIVLVVLTYLLFRRV
ncbi:MAG: DUF131 domain-containing protein [Methanobacteriota archaeon]|nr:MAG: DUF131 domain-containing protein [Euryarchaeota archaeon]